MMQFVLRIIGCFLVFSLFAEDKPQQAALKDLIVEVKHQIILDGKPFEYKTVTGCMVVRDENSKDKANVFFVAYVKEGVEDNHDRPIMFCFNGGPGSSSVWLHLGAFGPRLVDLDDDRYDNPPYALRDNPDTLLAVTDLVFIDPVSTGYSRAAPDVDLKEFHGVDEDIASVGSFIRLWTTRYGRWESPKYLAGESYGSTRAARLSDYMHSTYGMYMNGIVLISSILNFQTLLDQSKGNDLPYILYLPTYAATAWYHKKLNPEMQALELDDLLKQAEDFAVNDYATALLVGDVLNPAQRKRVIERMSVLIGLPPDYIDRANLRVGQPQFAVALLRDELRTVGRFDSRYTGDNLDSTTSTYDYDPSKEAVFGAFTAAFYQYVTLELNWKSDLEYKVLANVWPWSYGSANNTFLNVGPDLREAMIKNPKLRVLVANGIYDLATTYFANIYTFNHFNLPPNLKKNLKMTFYPSGHMMYTDQDSLTKLNRDITQFILNSD